MATDEGPVRGPGRICGGNHLIFVTVGTHTAPFRRLVRRMDEIAKVAREPVIIQTGATDTIPSNARYQRFFSDEDFEDLFSRSRVVVSHAGVGTILKAIQSKKPIICVPRLRRYQEHWDDHQLEICEELSRRGRLNYIANIQELSLRTLELATSPAFPDTESQLGNRVLSFLEDMDSQDRNAG